MGSLSLFNKFRAIAGGAFFRLTCLAYDLNPNMTFLAAHEEEPQDDFFQWSAEDVDPEEVASLIEFLDSGKECNCAACSCRGDDDDEIEYEKYEF